MAFDTYIKLDKVDGESTDDKHKKWIEVLGFAWGAGNECTMESGTQGLNTGKAMMSVLRVTKWMDCASVKLASAAVQGQNFPTLELEICTQAGDKFAFCIYKFTHVAVSSYQCSGATGGSDRPQETIDFAYKEVTWEYVPQDQNGKAGGKIGPEGWSLITNKKK
ncbi:type VI secretion system tube protein Hcp [Edwardsiella piscicida]|uniref:Type VI secretion system protein EvpC n=4 Tax=Edwardsiella TaxID=635 RepID=A0A0H3DSK2_EDWTF|nr:type VI secretion system tube protein Hcp [Edwardsiella piscicida]AAR83929.1 EvpC [Edwardsiella tarda]ACY85266.1 type VI secretion system protein EvpC [Edwardsiella tarda EIB202]ADM42306.1 type VI secretion system protein EvpC [Edwardsiella tarda FL6-60]AGH74423.1 type VI secretion system protein EvpC [Edwardsiella piscicida C07-087]AOP43621.1 type VI secretion system tube protein Hcp [Edwardsiella piscicida]